MAASEINVCFICEKTLDVGEIIEVKERGVKTLKAWSVKRKNKKHERLLESLNKITVHRACQTHYTNEKLITAAKRRGSDVVSLPSTSLRSATPSFNFKNHCFLCSKEITEEFIQKQNKSHVSRRNVVYNVRKLSVKDTVLTAARSRNDKWAEAVIERIQNVADLVAVDAMYHNACMKNLYQKPPTGLKKGQRSFSNVGEAMESIYSYLSENSDECQFKLDDLMNLIEGDYRPDIRTVKNRLMKQYGDDILVIERANESPIVCFKNTGYRILTDAWYNQKKTDKNEERLRIVRAAAAIVLEDIRSQVYETEKYAPSDDFMQDVDTVVPESVRVFFEGVILKNKRGPLVKWEVKCKALSHAVISAVRPHSFLSPLLIGIGAFLYKKFGSKNLINVLSAFGFSTSYSETALFERSCIMRPQIEIEQDSFSQFVFDNADFNINTLDGSNTFHAMGGIQCVTPYTAISKDQNISRLTRMPSAQVVGKSVPGWNGFMEQATVDQLYAKSKILCLPFINAPPSHYDTVYTSLLAAAEKCKALNQRTCFVTFDQPLYMKAREIIANGNLESDLSNVIVRLGGFHLLMSFLGSIGYIMSGSGLKDLFNTIYAENSVEKMMSGHAYSQAVRAHILCHLALAKVIFKMIDFTEEDRATMDDILSDFDRSIILSATENVSYQIVAGKFQEELNKIEKNGPTSKLWVQYFKMITLVKQFIEAERMGNWQLHLDTIRKMLPYFHASAHFFNAKSAHLYLQDMLHLKEKMAPPEYENFTRKGYFTIRRSDKFWSGVWSDMTIEQTLMRTMKSSGGLTQGCGITDSVITLWTLGMVYLHNVCDEVEKFCGISLETTEQHVDMRTARVVRDNPDLEKLDNWFAQHPPFPNINEILSISTGVVGNETINCHLSEEIGALGVLKMIGENFECIKFKRKEKVLPLSTITSSIRIDNVTIPINPLVLFQRMCLAKQSDEELMDYLKYELAPFPLSLFSEEGMRNGTKSSLYAAFTPLSDDTQLGANSIQVVDGGYLLHRVVWNRNSTFSSICDSYVKYVQQHHGPNAVVVFDGYPVDANEKNTKSAERLRRSRKLNSADILFDEEMVATVSQDKFLGNGNNKIRLISMLKNRLEQFNFTVKQATEDADVLIINTAITLSSEYDSVIVIGEDIDLLVLLIGLAGLCPNVYFRKPGKGKVPEKLYSASSLQYGEAVAENIMFIHAFSGCDTTSDIFNNGKTKFLNTVEKNPHLIDIVRIFKNTDVDPEIIATAGERFLISLYNGDKTNDTLDSLRYHRFAKSVTKSKFNLAALPPTREAARLHSFGTYYQVQAWCGVVKDPQQWGWQSSKIGLIPIQNTKDPAPQALLKFISCKCKTKCSAACGCRKAGLKCSIICGYCNGQSCENVPQILYDLEDDVSAEEIIEDIDIDLEQPEPSKRSSLQ